MDPCQLVWPVNEFCERTAKWPRFTRLVHLSGKLAGVSEKTLETRIRLQDLFTCQTSWQGSIPQVTKP